MWCGNAHCFTFFFNSHRDRPCHRIQPSTTRKPPRAQHQHPFASAGPRHGGQPSPPRPGAGSGREAGPCCRKGRADGGAAGPAALPPRPDGGAAIGDARPVSARRGAPSGDGTGPGPGPGPCRGAGARAAAVEALRAGPCQRQARLGGWGGGLGVRWWPLCSAVAAVGRDGGVPLVRRRGVGARPPPGQA